MLNKIVLIGRLAQDPELRYTASGKAVGNFAVAVERDYTNQQGERDVDFIRIVVWGKQAETCANHLGKGRLVAVDGRLQIRSYETKEGQRRTISEVVANNVKFLDWPSDNNNRNSNRSNNQKNNQQGQYIEEDIEVPF
ncbi:single-stranded DNA-binding protein [Halonatronum saccharophilum]|uniref:single-stranded DNA-binding protein n=1 Tax=Halonatronum saccharophilum TaxID=150060 RepID=UPI000486C3CA|nr:single-stranded DNA-binding protein [Halonatronum saccharophilum]